MSEVWRPRDLCRDGRAGRQRAVIVAFGLGGLMLVCSLIAFLVGWWTPWTGRFARGVDVSDFRKQEWVIWQRHNNARRRGVSEPVDLNAFRGDASALARLVRSADVHHSASSVPSPPPRGRGLAPERPA